MQSPGLWQTRSEAYVWSVLPVIVLLAIMPMKGPTLLAPGGGLMLTPPALSYPLVPAAAFA